MKQNNIKIRIIAEKVHFQDTSLYVKKCGWFLLDFGVNGRNPLLVVLAEEDKVEKSAIHLSNFPSTYAKETN